MCALHTLAAPTIIMADIIIVMHRLNMIIPLIIDSGSLSNIIVLYCKRKNIMIRMETMDSKMDAAPAIIDPVRNDWHRQQLSKIGFAIFRFVALELLDP